MKFAAFVITSLQEAPIRSFGVGLLALATIAVASLVFRRRRMHLVPVPGSGDSRVNDLYAAGL